MRASTLFAITLSVLLGLGAVATARYMGLFDKKEPPPPPAAEKPTVIRVLAPLSNLYEGVAVTPEQITVKEIRVTNKDEIEAIKQDPNKFMAKYLTGTAAAAAMRVPKKHIAADTPLLKEHFEEVMLPENVQKRLEPGTRAVNVAVPKKRAAGGGIWKDDYVEVWLTSKATLGTGKSATESLVSACVAKPCKVVMKRNSLWTTMAVDPDDKPIDFTLQANPYRAALIEYAAARGELSLRPTEPPLNKGTGSFNDLNSPEYADEDTRVSQVVASAYTIGDKDLMRVFNLKPPAPPPVEPPPPPPLVTRRILGTELAGLALYDPNGGGALMPADPSKAPPPAAKPAGPPPSYSFGTSKGKGSSGAECEDCGK